MFLYNKILPVQSVGINAARLLCGLWRQHRSIIRVKVINNQSHWLYRDSSHGCEPQFASICVSGWEVIRQTHIYSHSCHQLFSHAWLHITSEFSIETVIPLLHFSYQLLSALTGWTYNWSVGFQGFMYTPGKLYRVKVRVLSSIDHSQPQSMCLLAPLSEVAEPCHQEELLQEELRVQDSDVGCAANQRVGCVGQSMEHVLSDQPALLSFHNWLQEVGDHFCIHGPFRWNEHS